MTVLLTLYFYKHCIVISIVFLLKLYYYMHMLLLNYIHNTVVLLLVSKLLSLQIICSVSKNYR